MDLCLKEKQGGTSLLEVLIEASQQFPGSHEINHDGPSPLHSLLFGNCDQTPLPKLSQQQREVKISPLACPAPSIELPHTPMPDLHLLTLSLALKMPPPLLMEQPPYTSPSLHTWIRPHGVGATYQNNCGLWGTRAHTHEQRKSLHVNPNVLRYSKYKSICHLLT